MLAGRLAEDHVAVDLAEAARAAPPAPEAPRAMDLLLDALVVLFTALATLGAFIYNVCADLVGGVELTLAERD